MTSDAATQTFTEYRPLLFTMAYDLLGAVGEAEDVVQDAWLRWAGVDHAAVANPRGYLVRIVVNRSLERLRQLRRSREDYVGPWLPEPLWTTGDVADRVTDTEDLALGLLVVLETLSPLERAAFVLHDVFGFGHDEIAETLDRSPSAIRQLVHRARGHVKERRPRFEAAPDTARVAAERLMRAAVGGDLADLMELLAPDVVLHLDGGGAIRTALRPIPGADKVARMLAAIGPDLPPFDLVWDPAARRAIGYADGVPYTAVGLDIADGRVTGIYGVLNPAKLRHLAAVGEK
ncbi:RNA polymerase sigma factor SigJ [Microlunatus speluncae]|uniref:RNA polymerase sigma factor SigJ n=1 Tax=Microlunatus speluncae TaxID=2594267 RepID=UPI00126610BC|nr:RNA polymerase sigma factor SigJ [Microlunatus speluncae]